MTITRKAMGRIFEVILFAATLILGASVDQANSFKLPDTGQTLCYDAVGNVISCAGTGQDGAYTINPMSLHDNGNQTITDYNTGLQWQKCMAGRVNNATCDYPGNNVPYQFNWYQATGTPDATYNPPDMYRNICGELGGGWRLPTNLELMSIMDYSLGSPAIQATYFPNTVNCLWTSLPAVTETNESWTVNLDGGISFTSIDYNPCGVRCVRGAQTMQSLTDNGDGTVTDNSTGLIWQKGEPGSMIRADALNYCETLSFPLTNGHTDWRLPNIKELVSLVDYSVADYTNQVPAFNQTFFPNAVEGVYYWSSTRAIVGANTGNWVVASWDGELANGANSTSNCNVRCVRSGGTNVCPPTAPVMINAAPYTTISSAYTAATSGQSILMQAMIFTDGIPNPLNLTKNINVSLIGGWDCGYTADTGLTTIIGSVIIGGLGTVTIENVIIM